MRNYPTAPIDPRLNFPPKDSYQDRLMPLIDHEPAGGWIDVDIYRITLARPVDALIRAASRGVRIRMYLEPNEYANTARPGNKVQMDRLVAAAQQYPGTIEIRMRKHLGLNHQKTIWFHAQHVVVFGTSNWSDASDDNQLEANIFTDKVPGDPLNDFLFTELRKVFERKWNNLAPDGSIETVAWRTPTLPPPSRADDVRRSEAPPTSAGRCRAPIRRRRRRRLRRRQARRPSSSIRRRARSPARGWQLASDATAAGGTAVWNPNANKAKVSPALAAPASYVEKTFDAMTRHRVPRLGADAGGGRFVVERLACTCSSATPSRRRARADAANRHVELGRIPPAGRPERRGDSAWGWADNGWGVPAP